MDDNNQYVNNIDCLDEIPNVLVPTDGRGDTPLTEEINTAALDNLNRQERDLNAIQNKRVELDSIQGDLNDLMYRLNSFIADSQEEVDDVSLYSLEDNSIDVTEKQDGPQEKDLRLNSYGSRENLVKKMYSSDASNPPEINWDAVGPILQKHVADLQRLHTLNQMTNAVVKRIRNVTQISETLSNNNEKEEENV